MIEDLLIVAAGMGSRLRAKGDLKPLVEVGGTPLIEHALEAAFAAGLKRATIVTGYNANMLRGFLGALAARRGWSIQLVHNPDFQLANGLSVLMARDHLKGPFCLAMCDHMVSPELYSRLLAHPLAGSEVALAVDTHLENPFVDMEDVTKVRLGGDHILAIGKQLKVFNGYDTGIFAAAPALFDAIERYSKRTGDYSISGGMQELADRQRAIGVDVGGEFWIDVDSPEMHALASAHLAARKSGAA